MSVDYEATGQFGINPPLQGPTHDWRGATGEWRPTVRCSHCDTWNDAEDSRCDACDSLLRSPEQLMEQHGDRLDQFARQYPTDGGDVDVMVIQISVPGQGIRRSPIVLQPGQVDWLDDLLKDELTTARNAHPDGDNRCGHCEGD